MTVNTELISCLQKNKLILRGMGIMAFYTISLQCHFMGAFWILRDNSFVAFETNPVGIFVQKFTVRGGMRVMAF
jgi:hypothetical protein